MQRGEKLENKRQVKLLEYRKLNEEMIIPALESIGEFKNAELVANCGRYVNVINCVSCDTKHFGGACSCRVRYCFNCLHKRLLCWLVVLIPVFEEWYVEDNYISMLNFTVRDSMPLKVPLEMLENGFRKLYHEDKIRRRHWKERFPGGIRSLEVKLGKNSGEWHPHYHCLVMQKGGVFEKDYDWLIEAWHEVIGHNGMKVKQKNGTYDWGWNGHLRIKKIDDKGNKGILHAVKESLKYIVKVENKENGKATRNFYRNKELFEDLYTTLKNKKQTSTWGLLYGLKSKVDEDFKKETVSSLMNFICQKCGCTEGELKMILSDTSEILYDVPRQMEKGSPTGIGQALKK